MSTDGSKSTQPKYWVWFKGYKLLWSPSSFGVNVKLLQCLMLPRVRLPSFRLRCTGTPEERHPHLAPRLFCGSWSWSILFRGEQSASGFGSISRFWCSWTNQNSAIQGCRETQTNKSRGWQGAGYKKIAQWSQDLGTPTFGRAARATGSRPNSMSITYVLDRCVKLLAVLHISSAQGRSVDLSVEIATGTRRLIDIISVKLFIICKIFDRCVQSLSQ